MNNTSILIVDDEASNRDILTRRLLREGYTVAQAASGQQALSMMNVEKYDLVLLDIMMPEINDYAVLSTIKSEVRWRDTPVIGRGARGGARGGGRGRGRGAGGERAEPAE